MVASNWGGLASVDVKKAQRPGAVDWKVTDESIKEELITGNQISRSEKYW